MRFRAFIPYGMNLALLRLAFASAHGPEDLNLASESNS